MMISKGEKAVTALYRGDKEVKAVCQGEQTLWQAVSFNSIIRGYVNGWGLDGFPINYGDGTVEYWATPNENGYFEVRLDTSQDDCWMGAMFILASDSLKSLDLSGLDTSNVINMTYMFSGCSYLETLNLSNFDTSKVTNMAYMFSGCSYLESVDLSSFDTSNVEYMTGMFYGCGCLNLDLSNFNTSKVTDMGGMFNGCNNLETLDISSFDFSYVKDVTNLFDECSALKNLKFGTGLKLDLRLFYSQGLTRESMLSVINGLAKVDTMNFLYIDANTWERLTSEDIALANSKGWSIVDPVGDGF